MTLSPLARYFARYLALAYIGVLVIVPVGLILWRTFAPGFGEFISFDHHPGGALGAGAVTDGCGDCGSAQCDLRRAHRIGVGTQQVPRKERAAGDHRPAVRGVAGRRRCGLILLWGSAGLLGFVENDLGLKIIFGFPGIVLASIFVTVPFVIREVEPVLHELGTDQEEAAATLGSQWWQTFWRITLPSIRWGLTYGIVLTIARTLGEFGAVIMVSSNLPGTSQTLTLLVADRYSRGNEYGAYAVSTLLMAVAVIVLVVQVVLDARRTKAAK